MGGWDFQARIRSFKSEKFKKFKKFTVPSTDEPKCKQAFMAARMWKRMQACFAQGIINRACGLSLAEVFMSDRLFFP